MPAARRRPPPGTSDEVFPRDGQALIEPYLFENTSIPREALDPDAVRIVSRLRSAGFESYLVGGCVRDLMLGRRPKDFDIATEARPRKVKALFSNCRIIGRRFKLAHLHFGPDKIIEVSTFRRTPEGLEVPPGDDLLIRSDNVFGNAEQDAKRRDFTINGLFLDPEKNRIIDYVDGLEDLDRGLIRTIGDPWTRFREDPIRILRAVKFATRLGFSPSTETHAAMCETSGDLVKSAPPRVLEEILRLLRGHAALGAFQMLRDVGALPAIMPELSGFLARAEAREREAFWRHLEALDAVTGGGEVPETPGPLGTIFLPILLSKATGSDDSEGYQLARVADQVISPFAARMRLSRSDTGRLKRICVVHRRFTSRGRKKFKPMSFVRQDYFDAALMLFRIHTVATGRGWDVYELWKERLLRALEEDGGVRRAPSRTLLGEEHEDREIFDGAEEELGDEDEPGRDDRLAAEPMAGPGGDEPPAGDEHRERPEDSPREAGQGGRQERSDFEPRRGRRRRRRGRKGGGFEERRDGPGMDRPSGDRGPAPVADRPPEERRPAPVRADQRRPSEQRRPPDHPRDRGRNRDRGRDRDRGRGRDRGRDRDRGPERISGVDRELIREAETPILDTPAVELDPKQVPTFGSAIGDKNSYRVSREIVKPKGKRPDRGSPDDEPVAYVPPPPPKEPDAAPSEDTFGDW